jgi:hypothetical protein
MPPIGFVLAIVIGLGKTTGARRHAWLIAGLGIVACLVWTVVIASGALTTTDSSF